MKKILYLLTLALALPAVSCSSNDDPPPPPPPPPVELPYLLGKLFLNEVNVVDEDNAKYIELFNYSGETLEISGIVLRYRTTDDDNYKTLWTSVGDKIYSQGFKLVKGMFSEGVMKNGFTFDDGFRLELIDDKGFLIDSLVVLQRDLRPAEAQGAHNYARISNGQGNWYFDDATGTPGRTNGTTTRGKTRIPASELAQKPVISDVALSNPRPGSAQEVAISATVKAPQGAAVSKVSLLYWTTDEADKKTLSMSGSADKYTATIPGQEDLTVVNYTIQAQADNGGQATTTNKYVVVDGEVTTSGTVIINEILPSDKKWELHNPGMTHIDIGNWKFVKVIREVTGVKDGKEQVTEKQETYTFAANTIIPAGGFISIGSEMGIPFVIPRFGGFRFLLVDTSSTLIDDFDNSGADIINEDIVPGYSLARTPDGDQNNIYTYQTPSIGKANDQGGVLNQVVAARVLFTGDLTKGKNATITVNLTYPNAASNGSYRAFGKDPMSISGADKGLPVYYYSYNKVAGTKRTWSAGMWGVAYAGEWKIRFAYGSTDAEMAQNASSLVSTMTIAPPPYDYTKIEINEFAVNNQKYIELYNKSSAGIPLEGMAVYFQYRTDAKDKEDNFYRFCFWDNGSKQMIEPMGYYLIATEGSTDGIKALADTVVSGKISDKTYDMLAGNRTLSVRLTTPGQAPQSTWNAITVRLNNDIPFGKNPYYQVCTPDMSNSEYSITRKYVGYQPKWVLAKPTPRAENTADSAGDVVSPTVPNWE
ncbi:lamin tail domain-containing protein [Alistipes sp. OttesenSCG-928-L06]|nr:lamin tail domain-containing protein [Alistipes sp. OttesenSCG-928-L06]